jgi:hypothetical protein
MEGREGEVSMGRRREVDLDDGDEVRNRGQGCHRGAGDRESRGGPE